MSQVAPEVIQLSTVTGVVTVTCDGRVLTVSGPADYVSAVYHSIVYGIETWDESELTG